MQRVFPKCPICGSMSGYEFSGLFSRYVQCPSCKAKWKLSTTGGRIIELVLHELPKDGSSIYTITGSKTPGRPLFTVIGTSCQADFWKNLKLSKEVNWDFLSTNVSSDASKAVFLEKGEKLLHQWEGTREALREIIIGGKTQKFTKQEPGFLLLSTQRLLWIERRERGVLKKATSFLVVHEIPLQDIRGISGDTGDSSSWRVHPRVLVPTNISVVDKRGENKFGLKYAFLEIFKPIVEKAVEIRKKEIEAEKKKERVHVMLDFSFLKTYMGKGGLAMQVIKCPHCSAKIEFPESGTQIKCSYCGHTIYAQDIFETVKNLFE